MYGDSLFASSGTSRNIAPNAGFSMSRISRLPGYTDSIILEDEDSDASDREAEVFDDKVQDSKLNEPDLIVESATAKKGDDGGGNDDDASVDHDDGEEGDKVGVAIDLLQIKSTASADIAAATDTVDRRSTAELMDSLLQVALLRCLKYIIKDHTLPQPVSTVWSVVLK